MGIEVIAPEGVSTESEASAKDVAKIIRQIKAEKIPAVFIENITDHRLLDQIARETGAKIGGTLYTDALSPPDGPAADLSRHVPPQHRGAIAGAVVVAFGASSFERARSAPCLRMRIELLMVRSGRRPRLGPCGPVAVPANWQRVYDRACASRQMDWRAGGAIILIAAVVASLIPANMQIRTGLHWQVEHFLVYFAATSIFCLAWPRPFIVAGVMMAFSALLEALQGLTPDRTPTCRRRSPPRPGR